MSQNVEDRVVSLRFDNGRFLSGINAAISGLDRLKSSLNFGKQNGLNDVQASADKFSLQKVGEACSGVSGSFLALSTVAITALSNIVNRAVDAGINITKALTIRPALDGLKEYETNLNSIQTILSNTQASGATLNDVNSALTDLNHYSDKTIYNFAQMARNIGTFTAAGVDLDTSVASIKGIANLAALSGSNAEQAATAMYQLSQGISAGKIGLQDWNSVVNAGMGGATFQRALAETAVAMGKIPKEALTLEGAMKNVKIEGKSFRDSIMASPGQESWLTSDVLTSTLKQFTGDMTEAEIAAMGFSGEQVKNIQKMAETAMKAATEVKTLTGVLDTAKEVVGSGWAATWQIIFGDFESAKTMFTNISEYVNKYLGGVADARNKLLEEWDKGGGRDKTIEAILNVWRAFLDLAKPVQEAFKEIFPPLTAQQLIDFSKSLDAMTDKLKFSEETILNVKNTFKGFFAIFSIAGQVFGEILERLFGLTDGAGSAAGKFFEFTGGIGSSIAEFDKMLKQTDGVSRFFDTVGGKIEVAISWFKGLTDAIAQIAPEIAFGDFEGISEVLARFGQRLEAIVGSSGALVKIWEALKPIAGQLADIFNPLLEAISHAVSTFITTLIDAFSGTDINTLLDVLNTIFAGGIFLVIKNFFEQGFDGGIIESINESFGALTGTLNAMQTQIQAKTLMLIATAVGVLTASIVVLSLIDSDKLTKALTAITVGFGQLLASMAILVAISGSAGFIKMPLLAGSLILLAGAMVVMSAAVKNLSGLSWDELGVGLAGLAGMLALIVAAAYGLQGVTGTLAVAGLAMIPLATGIKILASAVLDMSGLSWEALGKGLAGLGGSLALVAAGMWAMPPQMIAQAASLVMVGVALKLVASAMETFGNMTWESIGKGMVGFAGSLALIAAAMWLMPPQMIAQAAALILVGSALGAIAGVLAVLSTMDMDDLGRSLGAFAVILGTLAIGLNLMNGTLTGSASLVVAAAAIAILAPAMVLLGALSWESIAKGLVAIAGVFAVLGVSALVLTPVIPIILALGAALLLIGAGLALTGIGALAVASAFAIFVAAMSTGLTAVLALIAVMPAFAKSLANGVIDFAVTIANGTGTLVTAIANILGGLLDAIVMLSPKIGDAVTALLTMLCDVIVENVPMIVEAAIKLIMGIFDVITDHADEMAQKGADLCVAFMDAIQKQQPVVTQRAYDFIIAFMDSLSSTIEKNSARFNKSAEKLGTAIIDGVIGGIKASTKRLTKVVADVGSDILSGFRDILGIHSPSREFYKDGTNIVAGVTQAIKDNEDAPVKAILGMGAKMSDAMDKSTENMARIESPVITPVVDLGNLKTDKWEIGMTLPKIDISKANATAAVVDPAVRQEKLARLQAKYSESNFEPRQPVETTKIEYNQYNNSPKALSASEIYSNTRSQLALVREGLNK